jgi:hypothetical protein
VKVNGLDDPTCQILETMVDSLSGRYEEEIGQNTDIAIPIFSRNFRQRLQIHHATHEEAFKKKTFEFAFKSASIASGRKAEMDTNDTSPGYDVIVDGQKFSLKTEAGKSINPKYITISKLMEARWMRECLTGVDFQRGMKHLMGHFSKYDRVLILRAVRVDEPFRGMRYDLLEIPLSLLKLVEKLLPTDFAPRGEKSGGSSATVKSGNEEGFKLRLDGSVEKVTINRLKVSLCKKHASWTVQTLLGTGDEEE